MVTGCRDVLRSATGLALKAKPHDLRSITGHLPATLFTMSFVDVVEGIQYKSLDELYNLILYNHIPFGWLIDSPKAINAGN